MYKRIMYFKYYNQCKHPDLNSNFNSWSVYTHFSTEFESYNQNIMYLSESESHPVCLN